MISEHLSYNLDIEKGSQWLRTTPGEMALQQPYYCSEAGHFLARSSFRTSREHKESYILFYTLKGEGRIEQNGNTVTVKEQDALLMNCRSAQKYRTLNNTWDHYWIHIDGNGIDALRDILIPDRHITPVHIPLSTAEACILPLLQNMENTNTRSILQDSYLIHQLLHVMCQEMNTNDSSSSARDDIMKTAEYIQSHYQEDLSLPVLLEKAHMSKSYYMRLFRQYIGTTPYNYLLLQRITKAKEMLEVTDIPVSEIALQTGFTSHSSFTVRFTAMTGESPQDYRTNAITKSVISDDEE